VSVMIVSEGEQVSRAAALGQRGKDMQMDMSRKAAAR
jgi:hypothetical protein